MIDLEEYLAFSRDFFDAVMMRDPVDAVILWASGIMLFTFFMRFFVRLGSVNRSPEDARTYEQAFDQWVRDHANGIKTVKPCFFTWDRPTLLTLIFRRIGFSLYYLTFGSLLILMVSLAAGFFSLAYWFALKHGDQGRYFFMSFWGLLKQPNYSFPIIGGIVLGWVLGRISSFFAIRYALDFTLSPWLNHRDKRVAVKSKNRSGECTDVRKLSLPEHIDFDPVAYFTAVNAHDLMFLGVDEERSIITLPRDIWVKSNVQVMGPPGTGKGVQASVVMSQALRSFDDAVIVFDPKNDEWAPHVLRKMAKRFVLVDLRRGKPAQINPFWKITPDHLFELFVAGFSLGTKGTDADHYRLGDRKAAYMLSQLISNDGATVFELLEAAKSLPDDVRKNAEGLIAQLEELSHIEAIQASQGVDIADVIANGGCLYFIGAMRDDSVIRLQKMLFVRVIQLVESRSQLNTRRHVTIFLDEVKYLLSLPSINALGTIRDKACNIILAHQSLGDFASAGADLDPEAVKTSIIDNTPLKWVYRVKSFDTAKWVSEQTGEIMVDVEQHTVNRDGAVEMLETRTRLSKERRFLIDVNTIQNLPNGCAVCIGSGIAKLAFANPIKVQKCPIELVNASCADVMPRLSAVRVENKIVENKNSIKNQEIETPKKPESKIVEKVSDIGYSNDNKSLEDFF